MIQVDTHKTAVRSDAPWLGRPDPSHGLPQVEPQEASPTSSAKPVFLTDDTEEQSPSTSSYGISSAALPAVDPRLAATLVRDNCNYRKFGSDALFRATSSRSVRRALQRGVAGTGRLQPTIERLDTSWGFDPNWRSPSRNLSPLATAAAAGDEVNPDRCGGVTSCVIADNVPDVTRSFR